MLSFRSRRQPPPVASPAAATTPPGPAAQKPAVPPAQPPRANARTPLTYERVRAEQLTFRPEAPERQRTTGASLRFAPDLVLPSSLCRLEVIAGFNKAKRVVAALSEAGLLDGEGRLNSPGMGPELLGQLLAPTRAIRGVILSRGDHVRLSQFLSMMATNVFGLGRDIAAIPTEARPAFFSLAWPQIVSPEHSMMLVRHLRRAGVLNEALLPVNAAPLAGELGATLADLFPQLNQAFFAASVPEGGAASAQAGPWHLASRLEQKLFATLPTYAASELPAYAPPQPPPYKP